jgi:site-specific recombinase XerD
MGENAKSVGITKDVHVHSLRHTYATHLLEDGMDIITLKDLWATKPETTLEYLQIAQLESTKIQPT